MVRITISDELKQQLLEAGPDIEFADESGSTILKVLVRERPIPPGWKPVTPELSEEELRRRAADDSPGIATEELLARLRAKK